jgi:hypothetical protein
MSCTFVIVIVIIIITGKTALLVTAFLRSFCQIVTSLHFSGCHNNNFFIEQSNQPCIQPQIGGTGPCIYVTQWQGQGDPVIDQVLGCLYATFRDL